VENAQGEKKTIPVPVGTSIGIDIQALHYNRKAFLDILNNSIEVMVCSSILG
jgi:hypothetical protein